MGALNEMVSLSGAIEVLDEQQIETIANKCGFDAQGLEGIFEGVEDLYANIY